MARYLGLCAVGLIVVGAMLLAGPVFGFSTIGADRGVNVATADDANALLAIEPTGDVPNNRADAEVITIRNNADSDFETLITDVTLDTNRLAVSDDFDASLASGQTTGLELTCRQGANNRQATVTIEADAIGPGLQVRNVHHSYTFEYSCTGGGNTPGGIRNVDAGSLQGPEPATQDLSFTMDGRLSKGETVTLEIAAYGVNYDDAEVSNVEGNHKHDEATFLERDGGSADIEYSPHNNLKAGDEVTITIDGIETDDWWWIGYVTVTESETGQTGSDVFTGSQLFGTASITASSEDRPATVTESDLTAVIEEDNRFDNLGELIELVEEADGVEFVAESS